MNQLRSMINWIKIRSSYENYKDSTYGYFWHVDVISAIFGLKKVQFASTGSIEPITKYMKLWSVIVLVALVISQPVCYILETNRTLDEVLLIICDLSERLSNAAIQLTNSFCYTSTNTLLYTTIDSIMSKFDLKPYQKRIRLFFYKNYLLFCTTLVPYVALIIIEILYEAPVYSFLFRIPETIQMLHFIIHVSMITGFLRFINSQLAMSIEDESKDVLLHKQSVAETIFAKQVYTNRQFDVATLMYFYDRLANCADLLGCVHGLQFFLCSWNSFIISVIHITFLALKRGIASAISSAVCVHNLASLLGACCACELLRLEVQRTDTLLMRQLIRVRCDPARSNKLNLFKQLVDARQMRFSCCGLFHVDYSLLLQLVVSTITYAVIFIQLLSTRSS